MKALAQVVIAVVDGGILPYHSEFRDDSSEGKEYPGTYISGYPGNAEPLNLTLGTDHPFDVDAHEWSKVRLNTLYWVPGTRIVGLIVVDQNITSVTSNPHGTMTASRAGGRTTSLAPESKLVLVLGFGAKGVRWAAGQPWIDIQSNSWGEPLPAPVAQSLGTGQADHDALAESAKTQITIVASGNGQPPPPQAGLVGIPAGLEATTPPGVIVVGGEDNGYVTPWSNTEPEIVADACEALAADPSDMTRATPNGAGTSAAAPYVAGALAAIVLHARQVVGDASVHHAGGVLAEGPNRTTTGPLSDGKLTEPELKSLLFATASLMPRTSPHDGSRCQERPGNSPYTSQVEISTLKSPSSFYFVGYGVVDHDSLAHAFAILEGREAQPIRTAEDQAHDSETSLRS